MLRKTRKCVTSWWVGTTFTCRRLITPLLPGEKSCCALLQLLTTPRRWWNTLLVRNRFVTRYFTCSLTCFFTCFFSNSFFVERHWPLPLFFFLCSLSRETCWDMEGGGSGVEASLVGWVHLLPAAAALWADERAGEVLLQRLKPPDFCPRLTLLTAPGLRWHIQTHSLITVIECINYYGKKSNVYFKYFVLDGL